MKKKLEKPYFGLYTELKQRKQVVITLIVLQIIVLGI